jgi:hypothetical protein
MNWMLGLKWIYAVVSIVIVCLACLRAPNFAAVLVELAALCVAAHLAEVGIRRIVRGFRQKDLQSWN